MAVRLSEETRMKFIAAPKRAAAIVLTLTLVCAQTEVLAGADPTPAIRTRKDAKGQPIALDTAIVRFEAPDGTTVDLVSAVHFGDGPYFKELNQRFRGYDAVLYELVAPKGTRVDPKARPKNDPIVLFSSALKGVLDLESQLDRVDYQQKNFVHADLSIANLVDSAKATGDDVMTILLEILTQMIRASNLEDKREKQVPTEKEEDAMAILSDPQGSFKLKRLLAGVLAADASSVSLLGPTINRLLISERNGECLRVLVQERAAGKRKVAIYYGAGHMADLGKRLQALGMRQTRVEWLTAWDLGRPRSAVPPMFHLLNLVTQVAAPT
jgi:hypothetical protein